MLWPPTELPSLSTMQHSQQELSGYSVSSSEVEKPCSVFIGMDTSEVSLKRVLFVLYR